MNNDKRIESLLKQKKYGKAYPILFFEILKELRIIRRNVEQKKEVFSS